MTIQVEFWQLVGLAITLAGMFGGLAKLLLTSVQKSIEQQIGSLGTTLNAQQQATARLERELLELKAELPRDYVRREDYIQAIATIMTKLDSMALRFENILLKGNQHDR